MALANLASLAAIAALPFLARPYTGPPLWQGTPSFRASRAWDDTYTLATQYPRRWSGGPDRKAAADWLAKRLVEAGLEVERERFFAWLGGSEPVELENLVGVIPGGEAAREIVVAVGNYDMAPTSFQAASDTAAHVGVLLELARVLRATGTRRTFVFLLADGEEWGMLGARQAVKSSPLARRAVAAASLEDLDTGRFSALAVDGMGQSRGFAPMWMRELARAAAAAEGYPTLEVSPVFEWVQRSVLVSFTDQGPFLGAGIPAVQLGGRGDDPALQAAVYHLPEDTVEKIRPESLAAYGAVLERVLRSIDSLPRIPAEGSFYLRAGEGSLVPGPRLAGALAIAFFPLIVGVVARARKVEWGRALAGELASLFLSSLAFLLVVLAARALPIAGFIPRYELYPPPPRHPLLTQPSYPVLGFLFGLGLGGQVAAGAMARPLGGGARGREAREARILACLLFLAALAAAGLAHNPFAALTFLFLPVNLWIWARPAYSAMGRLGALVLVAAGYLPLALLFAEYAGILGIGWNIAWYVVMGAAYGQFGLVPLALAGATAAVGVRLALASALGR